MKFDKEGELKRKNMNYTTNLKNTHEVNTIFGQNTNWSTLRKLQMIDLAFSDSLDFSTKDN